MQTEIDFNPSNMYYNEESTIFGLPHNYENSELIIVPVPWELTCSFRTGTAIAYKKIYECSFQIDLYDKNFPDAWKKGIFLHKPNKSIININKDYKQKVLELRKKLYKNIKDYNLASEINKANEKAFNSLQIDLQKIINDNKKIALLGGEHSITYNLIKVLSNKHNNFSIIQIDAHADLRAEYEMLKYSHASVMYNILKDFPEVRKIINIGLRDYSHEEAERIKKDKRIYAPDFLQVRSGLIKGKKFSDFIEEIIDNIPTEKVYISFDIDGLDVPYCPGTGTPVPGGLSYAEALTILQEIKKTKQIIGFDLCEVASADNNEINFIIATHLLYKLCLLSLG